MAPDSSRESTWQSKLLLVFVLLAFGMLSWPYFLYMSRRAKRPDLRWYALIYAMPPALITLGITIAGFAGTVSTEDTGYFIAGIGFTMLPFVWIVGIFHGARVNSAYSYQIEERVSQPEQPVPHSDPGTDSPLPSQTVRDVERLKDLIRIITAWRQRGLLSAGIAQSVLEVADQELAAMTRPAVAPPVAAAPPKPEKAPAPAPAPVAAAVVSEPVPPKPRPTPPAPRKPAVVAPAGPAFSWREVGTYILSERTLIALLALGAFMVLVSGSVISILNPTELSPLPHLGTVAATAAIFFTAGYVLRTRLELVRTGEVLLAIGGGFVPLAVWILGGPGLLNWTTATIWFVASLGGLGLYLVFYRILLDRAFAALSSIAAGSTLLAAFHLAQIPIEWGLCALIALAAAYVVTAKRLRPEMDALSSSLNWSSQIVVPAIMLGLMIIAFFPEAWDILYGREQDLSPYAVGTAWWFGAAFYLVAYRTHAARVFLYASLWVIPIAYLFTMTEAPWSAEWYNVGLVVLAGIYLLANQEFRYRLPIKDWKSGLLIPELQVALALTVFAAIWPFASLDSAIPTLYAGATLYAIAAYQLRSRLLHYAASYLFPVPFVLTFERLNSAEVAGFGANWLPFWIATLAVAYFVFAYLAFTRGRTEETAIQWPALIREPVYQVTLGVSAFAIIWPEFSFMTGTFMYLILATLFAVATALLRQRPLAYLAMVFLIISFALAVAWTEVASDTRVLLWALGSAFLLIAAELVARFSRDAHRAILDVFPGGERWNSAFAQPLFAGGYAVSLTAILLTLGVISEATIWPGGALELTLTTELALLVLASAFVMSAVMRRTSLFLYGAAGIVLFPGISLAIRTLEDVGATWSEARFGIVLAGIGIGYFAVALLTDRFGGHYAKPVFLFAYALSVISVLLAAFDRASIVLVLGVSITIYAVSAWLVHVGRHPSYQWGVDLLFPDRDSLPHRTAQSLFLYPTLFLVPAWVALAMSLSDQLGGTGKYGVAFALLAPIYLGMGVLFQRIRMHYAMPWQIGGLALSAIGFLVAIDAPTLRIIALGVTIGLYSGLAYATRNQIWTLLVALLLPLWVWQGIDRFSDPEQYYGIGLVALSLGYAVIAMAIHHKSIHRALRTVHPPLEKLGVPFIVLAYIVNTVGLMLIPDTTPWQQTAGFGLAAALYGISIVLSRKSLFAYPFVLTFAFTNLYALDMTPISERFLGIGLLPGVIAIFAAGAVLRSLEWSKTLTAPPARFGLDHVYTPFFIATYVGTVIVLAMSTSDWTVAAMAWWAATAIFAVSIYLFRRPEVLYPSYAAGLVAAVATTNAVSPDLTFPTIMSILVVPGWLAIWAAIAVLGRGSTQEPSRWPLIGIGDALDNRWTKPLVFAGGATVAIAIFAATPEPEPGLFAALVSALLIALLATLRSGHLEAWLSLGLAALSLQQVLRILEVQLMNQPLIWVGAAVAIALTTTLLRGRADKRLKTWFNVLSPASILLGFVAVAFGVAVQLAEGAREALDPLSLTVSMFGVVLITYAYVQYTRMAVYAGVGALILAYVIRLVILEVTEPQAFALPAGIYLLAIAFNEWRRGTRQDIRHVLEITGVAMILGTTALQSIGIPGIEGDRYEYALILLIQSLAIFGLAAIVHWRNAFFGGIAGTIVSIVVFLEEPVRSMNTWYLVLVSGIIMLIIVGFIERRRNEIPLWIDDWRSRLESWS
jgi:hypothetical protein